jgi:uncharacterized membrane protein
VAQALPPVVGPSVTVKLPPARPVAVVVTKPAIEPKAPVILPRANPELKIADDLQRFKESMEAGTYSQSNR